MDIRQGIFGCKIQPIEPLFKSVCMQLAKKIKYIMEWWFIYLGVSNSSGGTN